MSKIILFLPGNIFHSNVVQENMLLMLAQKAGMMTLRRSPIPLVLGWQRIDELLAPDIYDPESHELCSGSLTHVLHNRLTPERSAWQTAKGAAGSRWKTGGTGIDVTFHPEFSPPADPELIPTEYFFLSAPNTAYYDYDPVTGELDVSPPPPLGVPAIKFGSKIGILIYNQVLFGDDVRFPIRDQWHEYQNDPRKKLGALVDATSKVTELKDPVHIVCWDLETPYVPVRIDKDKRIDADDLWQDYFEALDKRNLLTAFSPLQDHLDWFKEQAVEVSQPPHRLLDKWAHYDPKLDYLRRVYDNLGARTSSERKRWLLAIARSSDILSAMHSQIKQAQEPDAATARYRKELVRLSNACLDVLEGKASLEALAIADPILGPRLVNLLKDIR